MSVGSINIRTRSVDDTTFVDLRISHPMESGWRKDAQGVTIPSWFLTKIDVFHNDERITELQLGALVSRNPAISLALNGGVEDDIIKVIWVDNRGEAGEASARIQL